MFRKLLVMLLISVCILFAERVDSKKVNYDFGTQTYKYNNQLFTGTSVLKNSQGEIVKELEIKDGKLNGYDIMYVNENVSHKKHYVNGVQEGKTYVYSLSDYKLYQVIDYKKGKKHGLQQTYNTQDEFLESESFYKDGIRDGEHKTFFKNGKLKVKGCYKDRKKSGKWVYYKEDGSIRSEKDYK